MADWLVTAIKGPGVAVALLSIARRSFVAPGVIGTLLWAAFTTTTVLLVALPAVLVTTGLFPAS